MKVSPATESAMTGNVDSEAILTIFDLIVRMKRNNAVDKMHYL